MGKKILIDTDPGIDDAMAVLCALRSPELEVVGLTTVFGNGALEIVSQNALRLVELEGNGHIPVAKGCGKPMVRGFMPAASEVHGDDGLGDIHLPEPHGKLLDKHAVQFIIETVRAHPGEITLAPIGPLTNIGMAVQMDPGIVDLVDQVILMGGAASVPGNYTPVAEANIWNDPEAARIVFSAGWDLTMVGLDVTEKVVMTPEYFTGLKEAGNAATDLIDRMIPYYQKFYEKCYHSGGAVYTHDPSAILYAIDPSLFQTKHIPIYVETEGRCAGQTVPDVSHTWMNGPLTNVCLGVDAERCLSLYQEILSRG